MVQLMEFGRSECLAQLATVPVGRIVFSEYALPAAEPVFFVLDDEEIICWTCGERLAAAVDRHVVAFEVDEIDEATRTGWSVCGVGEACEVVDPVRLRELALVVSPSWPCGRLAHVISVPMQRLTGRQLALADGVA